jgi:hypothetical protein
MWTSRQRAIGVVYTVILKARIHTITKRGGRRGGGERESEIERERGGGEREGGREGERVCEQKCQRQILKARMHKNKYIYKTKGIKKQASME